MRLLYPDESAATREFIFKHYPLKQVSANNNR